MIQVLMESKQRVHRQQGYDHSSHECDGGDTNPLESTEAEF